MKKLLFATAGCAALMTATSASAADFLFDFDAVDPANNFSFILDSSPTPAQTAPGGFVTNGVSVTLAGGDSEVTNITFLTDNLDGGLFFNTSSGVFDLLGPQLFTGTTSVPTFSTGSFALTDVSRGSGTLTIGALTTGSAVPEPATWALMLLGFFAIGAMMRRKATVNSVSVSYS